MNESDAGRIAAVLDDLGYQNTDDDKLADIIITVACSVRQSAIDRIYGKAKIWNQLKKIKPLTIILTGCLLGTDKQKMTDIFDFIFEINDYQNCQTF